MYMVKATVNGQLAGIGRVVGDYSIVCMLTDICVKPEFQKMSSNRVPANRRQMSRFVGWDPEAL